MVDLTEFNGDDALRASLIKKRDKAESKRLNLIQKAQEKIAPIEAEIAKYDEMLAVLDKHKPAPKTDEPKWSDEGEAGVSNCAVAGVTDAANAGENDLPA